MDKRNVYYDFPRSGWSHIIYPYLEEGATYDQLPKAAASQTWMPWWDPLSLSANSPTKVVIPVWLCPSDDGALTNTQAWGTFSLGNYHAFFGGLNLEAPASETAWSSARWESTLAPDSRTSLTEQAKP